MIRPNVVGHDETGAVLYACARCRLATVDTAPGGAVVFVDERMNVFCSEDCLATFFSNRWWRRFWDAVDFHDAVKSIAA